MQSARAERVALHVRGIVQGVGMRPFVAGLARRLGLAGSVENRRDGVWVEIEGARDEIARFEEALAREAPPVARIDAVERATRPVCGTRGFVIAESKQGDGARAAWITPDAATCDECLRELFDPGDRRHGYAFASCARCGPRLTIVTSAPYDRARTTMSAFPLCEACDAELHDESDRRFHAQTIACPACGPRLALESGDGGEGDPLACAVAILARGGIVGVKGLGGYHLACDATDEAAVGRLRARKRRDEKPFALLVRDADAAAALCAIDHEERALLASVARPIVLLRRRPDAAVADAVAPGMNRLGVMLPYTPLHHLLARALDRPLVLTSGNATDEPIAFRDDDARARLGSLVDAMLVNDRPIYVRCDDSVAHVIDGRATVLRRSRGYAPAPIALPRPLARPTAALGGQLKAVLALGAERDAFASHHFGDLDDASAFRAYREALDHYVDLFGVAPERVVHDLHPDYATSVLAGDLALPRIAVQHHEAHAAGALAEAGLDLAIAFVLDGAGYGRDGAIWGGEVLVGAAGQLERVAHLRYVRMPGGDRAAREPWRMAVAHAHDAGVEMIEDGTLASMIATATNAPRTSSTGRLFDAVAALLGVRRVSSFEAQAAMELQALAESSPPARPYGVEIVHGDGPAQIDTRPLVREVVREVAAGVDRRVVARRFHEWLAAAIAATASFVRESHGHEDVVLTGGVFANALLATRACERLRDAGFRPFVPRAVPVNDGGLAYGQLAHVAALDATEHG